MRECRRTWAIPSVTPFPAHCQLASIAGRVARKAELSHQTLLPHGGTRKLSGICNSVISCSKQEKWATSLRMDHRNGIPPAEGKRYSNALDEPAAWFSISILDPFASPIQPLPIRSAARDRQIYACKSRHTLVTAQGRFCSSARRAVAGARQERAPWNGGRKNPSSARPACSLTALTQQPQLDPPSEEDGNPRSTKRLL